jgi:hypothetical protein
VIMTALPTVETIRAIYADLAAEATASQIHDDPSTGDIETAEILRSSGGSKPSVNESCAAGQPGRDRLSNWSTNSSRGFTPDLAWAVRQAG